MPIGVVGANFSRECAVFNGMGRFLEEEQNWMYEAKFEMHLM